MDSKKKAEIAAYSLELAWLEFADYEQPSLKLRERYEALLRSAEEGNPTDYPDRPWQIFEPAERSERGRMAEQREDGLRKNLFHMLADAVLSSTGLQVSPAIEKRRAAIPPSFFRAIRSVDDAVDWITGTVTVGTTIFTDVRVFSPRPPAKRGRGEKQSNVRRALEEVMRTDPAILDKSHGEIESAVLATFESYPDLRPRGGVSKGTVARAVRQMRGNQK